jgi:hypothetical protein
MRQVCAIALLGKIFGTKSAVKLEIHSRFDYT